MRISDWSSDVCSSDLCPRPVRALVEEIRQIADLLLLGGVVVEIRRGGQHAGEQERAVHGGQIALPGALAAAHVEEVIVEPAIPGGIGLLALRTAAEAAQGGQGAFDGSTAGQQSALAR